MNLRCLHADLPLIIHIDLYANAILGGLLFFFSLLSSKHAARWAHSKSTMITCNVRIDMWKCVTLRLNTCPLRYFNRSNKLRSQKRGARGLSDYLTILLIDSISVLILTEWPFIEIDCVCVSIAFKIVLIVSRHKE